MIWRLGIYKLFREIFKFRDFKKAFMNLMKSIFAHTFAIFKYFYDLVFSVRIKLHAAFSSERGQLKFSIKIKAKSIIL